MDGRESKLRRAARWAARHKVWTAVIALVVIVVVATAAGAGNQHKPPSGVAQGLQTLLSPSDTPTFSTEPTESASPFEATSPVPTIVQAASGGCRAGNPLANVYHPDRLQMHTPCITVSGVVTSVRHEDDGDYHFNIRLDSRYASLIDSANEQYEGGGLVAEIVPADQPGCTPGSPPKPTSGSYDYGTCTGADLVRPAVGDRVTVTGPYVLDSVHGWMEVHPVWKITETAGTSASSNSAPAGATLRISSISPDPVNPGQNITLAAKGPADDACTITVTYASGHVSTASGLGPASTDADGNVSWTWKVGTSTGAGTATADVACGSLSARGTFNVT